LLDVSTGASTAAGATGRGELSATGSEDDDSGGADIDMDGCGWDLGPTVVVGVFLQPESRFVRGGERSRQSFGRPRPVGIISYRTHAYLQQQRKRERERKDNYLRTHR
jgi:hypothetical protein